MFVKEIDLPLFPDIIQYTLKDIHVFCTYALCVFCWMVNKILVNFFSKCGFLPILFIKYFPNYIHTELQKRTLSLYVNWYSVNNIHHAIDIKQFP